MIRLAIHGGAGVIDRERFGGDRERRYREALQDILGTTYRQLSEGASAVEASEAAVVALENCEYFNAGRGAVLNRDGVAEMDAAIMDGTDRACGAVAAMRSTRNPVSLARAVMEDGEHVLLAGPGADRFGHASDLPQESDEYFITDDRRQQLAAAARAGRVSLDHDEKYGTVGAVARDSEGRLAAATSTGGMTNKLPGRVGDSPIIGVGTWADNRTCAISGTGHGEFFMKTVLAYDVHARMCYGGQSLADAATDALNAVGRLGGSGGMIAVGADGTIAMPFNSPGMYRACVDGSGEYRVGIYRGET